MILQEEIFEKAHYDIIVAGGGVGGAAAAVQAAREGKRVLLVEKSQKLGGLATLGLVNFFVPMCNGRGKQIIFGMAEEMLRLSIKYGYGGVDPAFENGRIPDEKLAEYKANGHQPPRYMTKFSAEIFALTLTELCHDAGVDIMFDSIVSRAVTTSEGGKTKILGVVLENKSGREYFTADMFVDATGDGDLMYRAGIPTVERGNYHSYFAFAINLDSCRKAAETGKIANAISGASGGYASLYGENHPKDIPLYHGTSSDEVNRYLISNQLEMLEKLKKDDRNSRDVVTLPGMCQFRTVRHIAGAYTLLESDTYRHFEDSVGAMNDFDRRDYLFEIPYGTLISPKASNLITCGRSAAGEGYAWDVLRVIPPAIISGQAAGFAVSQAVDRKCDILSVSVPELQKSLEGANVTIHFDDADVPAVSDATIEHND